MDLMKVVEKEFATENQLPQFNSGDTITVHYKIKEGNKERIQMFRELSYKKKAPEIPELLR